MRELLFTGLAVACPLMMVLMMRSGHGHGGHRTRSDTDGMSADELRDRRAELDRLIAERDRTDRTTHRTEPIGRDTL